MPLVDLPRSPHPIRTASTVSGCLHPRKAPGDLRVVARDDLGARPRELLEHVICRIHLREVSYHGERPVELEFLVEVHRVGREHDVSVVAPDDRDQLTGRMAADCDRGHAFGDLLGSVDQPHATRGGRRLDERDLALLDERGELEAPGQRTGPEVQLAPRDDQPRRREGCEVADVVVVEVGHEHRRDGLGLDAERSQGVRRRLQARPPAPRADLGSEAAVDDDRLVPAPEQPEPVRHLDLGVRLAVARVAVEELRLRRSQAAVAGRRRPRRARPQPSLAAISTPAQRSNSRTISV